MTREQQLALNRLAIERYEALVAAALVISERGDRATPDEWAVFHIAVAHVPPKGALSNCASPHAELLEWAVDRWNAEVAHRPLVNQNRRPLDDCWRQVIRRLGGDDIGLLGPRHDDLVADLPS